MIDELIFQSWAADRELDSLVDGGKNGLQHCVVTPALSMRRSLTWLKRTAVHLVASEDRLVPMIPDRCGYWRATASRIEVGTLYLYRWDEEIERCPISTPAIPSFTTTTGVTTYGS